MKRAIICMLAASALVLGACSSGSSSGSSAGSSASDSGGESAGEGGSSSSDRVLCEEVTAEQVGALTGESITSAEELSSGARFRTGFEGPSCVYETATGLGGVSAEFVSAETYEALITDPVLSPEPMSGVGDEAYQVVDQIDNTLVIRTISKQGDEYLFVQIFNGTSADNAAELTNALLG